MRKQLFRSDRNIDKKRKREENPALKASVFATALGKNQPDRSYYKSLYKYDPKVELSEYSLPFFDNATGKSVQASKVPSGIINAAKLPPIGREEAKDASQKMDEDYEDFERVDEDNKMQEEEEERPVEQLDYKTFMRILDNVNESESSKKNTNLFLEAGTPLYEQVRTIKTGEDCIAFFARYGNTTGVKFLHCNRSRRDLLAEQEGMEVEDFRPYDLRKVEEREKLDPEYFTISAQGVVHICPMEQKKKVVVEVEGGVKEEEETVILRRGGGEKGETLKPTETYTLSEWMRESTLFNVLRNIKFFKFYISSKAFTMWKGIVRYQKFRRTREQLSKELIFSKRAFTEGFVEICGHIVDLQNEKTFKVTKQNISNLDNGRFKTMQVDCRKAFKEAYDLILKDRILRKLEDVIKAVKESEEIKDEDEGDQFKTKQSAMMKSMVKMKEEKRLKEYCLKLARLNKGMLVRFVQLVDYMVVEALIKIHLDSVSLIFEEMSKTEKRTEITTEVDYSDTAPGMLFLFGYEAFWSMLKDILEDMEKVMDGLNRAANMVEDSSFRPPKKANIFKLIENSEGFNRLKDAIEKKLESDFQLCQEYADSTFLPLREVRDFITNWRIDALKEMDSENAVKEASTLLNKLDEWKNKTKYLEQKRSHGMVHVDGSKVHNTLNSGISTASDELKKFLKGLADDKTNYITNKLSELKKNLDPKDYTVVPNFCKLITNKKDSGSIIKELNGIKTGVLEKTLASLKRHRREEHGYNDDVPRLQDTIATITSEMVEVERIAGSAGEVINKHKKGVVEALEKEVTNLRKDTVTHIGYLDQEKLLNPDLDCETALEELQRCQKNFATLKNKWTKNKEYYQVLELGDLKSKEATDYDKRLNAKVSLWEQRKKWKAHYDHWMHHPLNEIDSEQFQKNFSDHRAKSQALKGELGKEKPEPILEQYLRDFKLVQDLESLICSLTNKALEQKHWKKIYKALDQEGAWVPGKVSTLTDLLQYNLKEKKEEIEAIANAAVGEYNLTLQLRELENSWDQYTFTLIKDSKERFLLSETEKIYELLENDQMKISSMLASKYIVEVRDKVELWETLLGNMFDVLEEWLTCQRNWIYLESVFSAGDIQKQLPKETESFKGVDKFWKDIMGRTNKIKKVKECCCIEGIKHRFVQSNTTLDEIRKSLENYLTSKRKGFPRFYFLSNDELIAILSETRNPHAVQPHLRKCFDAIAHIEFTEAKNSKEMISMQSSEGERVAFVASCFAEGNVEHWMGSIEEMMKRTLREVTKRSLEVYPPDGLERKGWMFAFPAQSVITVDQITWTRAVTEAIKEITEVPNPNALEKCLDFCKSQINKMVEVVRGGPEKLDQATVETLVVLDVHGRDVVRKLIDSGVTHETDFDWQRQLRYYWEMPEDNCFAKQTKTVIEYSYEYIGNSGRLVITPLTDKCYMTMTGALYLTYGGNPQGPAGTGKTETVKDLAKAIGVQCVVFNCSDSLDINFMARYFSGLAYCGAWSCFDEFNRIDVEVLSVIAQQILTIQSALREKRKELDFEHDIIQLNPRFGVFITMNPGYAGRTELPDNLKALFRPVAMMIPDYAMIAEIILFSQGFQQATALANKMVQLYRLSSEQLSKQSHYDFGMRAVKSVLVMAGALRRKYPDLGENIVLIRAMRDSNVPKFLHEDLSLFNGIIHDLFPTVHIPNIPYGDLERKIREVLKEKKLKDPDSYVKKVIQLFETLLVRHGIMIVGETGTGKTTCSNTLAQAMTELEIITGDPMHRKVNIQKLNPKSITMKELYGYTNVDTNEWFTGLIPHIVSEVVLKDKTDTKYFMLFDGPVDALWIENMNTVLDDSKMLCLANGERIKLPPTLTMMFEVQDLKVASPATVSRCGMVYLESIQLGLEPIIDTWFSIFDEPEKDPVAVKEGEKKMQVEIKKEYGKEYQRFVTPIVKYMKEFIKAYLNPSNSMRDKCKEKVPSVDVNLVKSCLNLFTSLIDPDNVDLKKKENPETLTLLLFLFSFIWSFGANIHEDTRKDFNQFMKYKMSTIYTDFPETGNVYDYYVDIESQQFVPWSQLVPEFAYKFGTPYFKIVVPTVDTVKYKYVVDKLTAGRCNVLFTGETGVGKTIIFWDFLNKAPEDIECAFANFSAKTTAGNLQSLFESKLDKKGKRFTPHSGKKMMIFFVDDVNMPQLDRYGSQPPCELLRQTIDQKGFYNLKKFFFHTVNDTIFLAACAPPGGGRNAVTPRLFRHFNMIWLPDVPQASMELIFTSILKGFLSCMSKGVGLDLVAPLIVRASVGVYLKIKTDLLPTPKKCHYTFNLRDISKVIQGILAVNLDYLRDKSVLLRLWLHEAFRVFRDRLVENRDWEWFNDKLTDMMKQHIEIDWPKESFKDVLFCHFGNDENEYQEVTDVNLLIDPLQDKLDIYNSMNPGNNMSIVFFKDCIFHLASISRILKQQRGNALLVGVGGSGRRGMARLGSSIANFGRFEIEINKSYKEKEFHEDLKGLLKKAGLENQEVMFLFSDSQIIFESFLEDINSILNTGEVPNLMAVEDIEQIVGELRPAAKLEGRETRDQIMQFFVQRCRESLHVILTFSPVGDMFRNRTRQFPSLINCCTIDWYHAWPPDALQTVAQRKYEIEESNLKLGIGSYIEPLSRISVEMHISVSEASETFFQELRRRNYTTPTSYLELTKSYIDLMKEQRMKLPALIRRYKRGLERMAATNKMVDEIKETLIRLGPEIDEKEKQTQILVVEIEEKTKIAQEEEKTCQVETQATEELVKNVAEIKSQCDADLALAMPAYKKAQRALNTLNPNDIKEMKSYTNPPTPIVVLMKCVCMLNGKTESWDDAKIWMNRPNDFLDDLKNYKKESMPMKLINKLKAYLEKPELTVDMSGISKAAASIAEWTKALYSFAIVYRDVGPKIEKQKKAEAELAKVNAALKLKVDALDRIRSELGDLRAQHTEQSNQLQSLKEQKQLNELHKRRAEELLTGLADESERWKLSMAINEEKLVNVVGNMMICAGYLSYLGPFTSQYREAFLKKWLVITQNQGVPHSKEFSFESLLGDPVQIQEWNNVFSLPADKFSIENGIITHHQIIPPTNSKGRWPLIIDPQGQANQWIKKLEHENGMHHALRLSDPKYTQYLINAIRIGQPVLLENIGESLDPFLEPLLQKQISKEGSQLKIKLGEDIPFSTEFKLYITTKLANPHYLPDICIKVTLINFTVTPSGLEDQLLVRVVQYEKPELETERGNLILNISQYQKELKDIEDKILKMVSEASDDILNDDELINKLKESKSKSILIGSKMEEAKETSKKINRARDQYRPVAIRGSVLYFVIADLGLIEHMYQYSLDFFMQLFGLRMDKSPKSESIEERIDILITDITWAFYSNICRGLFEKDKLLYSFLKATAIMRRTEGRNKVSADEWNCFLRGSMTDFSQEKFDEDWLDTLVWQRILGLEESHYSFKDLKKSFKDPEDQKVWKEILLSDDPLVVKLPAAYEDNMTAFQKLMLLKVLREEKLMSVVNKYVSEVLGDKFTRSPAYVLMDCYNDSTAIGPLIFVLVPGADPMIYLQGLAKDREMDTRFKTLSLGQGQGKKAAKMIEEGRRSGDWVCLQNCHLAASWMPELEKIQEGTQAMAGEINPDYRLWLTSFPTKAFPVPVLQLGVKITNEPPRGLKNNMLRTFNEVKEEFYESCKKPEPFKKMLFALAFFHAVTLERRKFGSIGWNIPYDWMDSDFEISKRQLLIFLDEQPDIPYIALNYLIAEINYGGRVTDDKDVRLIKAMLERYFNSEIMREDYKLHGETYVIPPVGKLDNVFVYIKDSLPVEDAPGVYGLHDNATITMQQKIVRDFFETLLSIQPRVSGGRRGQSPEEMVMEIARKFQGSVRTRTKYMDKKKVPDLTSNSLGVFLGQEVDRFNVLYEIISKSLDELQRAIKGEVVMSIDLEEMFTAFLNKRVPAMWAKVAYLSLKPLSSWVTDFIFRMEFMTKWLYEGQQKTYWVSAFFFPQGFMTAAKQMYSRKTNTEIDTLIFKATVYPFNKESVEIVPENGVNIHGLYLQGGGLDKDLKLVESEPKQLFYEMPVIWLEPKLMTYEFGKMEYDCPVYKTSSRAGELSTTGHSTNFILFLNMDSPYPPEHWIMRGTAMLCQLDD